MQVKFFNNPFQFCWKIVNLKHELWPAAILRHWLDLSIFALDSRMRMRGLQTIDPCRQICKCAMNKYRIGQGCDLLSLFSYLSPLHLLLFPSCCNWIANGNILLFSQMNDTFGKTPETYPQINLLWIKNETWLCYVILIKLTFAEGTLIAVTPCQWHI